MSKRRIRRFRFAVGDFVKPKPEWIEPGNELAPTGLVVAVEPSGADGAVRVQGYRTACAAYALELVTFPTDEMGSASI